MKTLSILIPTYNSQSTLLACVNSLNGAADHAGAEVNIYIFDNCSEDNTQAIAIDMYANNLISGYQFNGRNIGMGTFYKMAHWYYQHQKVRGAWVPVMFMDSEDIVSIDFFNSLYAAANSEANKDNVLVIPQYALRALSNSCIHNNIGTNSFYMNAKYLPLRIRSLACLLSPGAVGYTSIVWGILHLQPQSLEVIRDHTRKFLMNPGILDAAWENTLCATLLSKFDYSISAGVLYRGCIDTKFVSFPGADSALASFIYIIHDGSLPILENTQRYSLLPEDMNASLNEIISLRANLFRLVQALS